MLGFFSIILALLASGISAYYFYNSHTANQAKRSGKASHSRGLSFYWGAAGLTGIAALYLLYIILSNNFQYAYVFSYSSRELSLVYKLSAFWAGQEGSFMLWVLVHVVFGITIARQKSTAPGTLFVYSLIQIILLVFLTAKSPFMMIAEPQADGNGLNPLLQDPWMVIHPPFVFLGYAGLAIPFAYAINGILSNEHSKWVQQAIPWTLLSWAALGAGIFIGGFWAYKVLGWGGYWAWDPVENSSLVPWLIAGAFLHLLFLSRVRPAASGITYMGAIFSFVLVLYGTYLTRSGILSDFSTHSFSDEGIGGVLGVAVFITVIASLALLLTKWLEFPKGELYPQIQSREFILTCAALVFAVLGILVLTGMSTPLITMMLGNPQSAGTSFYNNTSLPLAIAMVLLLTFGSAYKWGNSNSLTITEYVVIGVVGSTALGVAVYFGLKQPLMLLVVAFSATALLMNFYAGVKSKITWPAGITHAGVAIALLGIIASSVMGRSEVISLNINETNQVFGKTITFTGMEESRDPKGFYHKFTLQDESGTSIVRPFTKQSKEGKEAAREPGIYRGLLADLYVAPVHKHDEQPAKEITIRKGEQVIEDGITLTFVNFSMHREEKDQIRVQTTFTVAKDGKTQDIYPEFVYRNGNARGFQVKAFEKYEFMIGAVNPNGAVVKLGMKEVTAKQDPIEQTKVDVDVSEKPLINLVWLGTRFIMIGTIWAGIARAVNIKHDANQINVITMSKAVKR